MVRPDDVYQRQADTLIVWTELNGKDYALSFQDVEGCTEVWEFITEVRRHLRATQGIVSIPILQCPLHSSFFLTK
jgi:protein phosphatase-4 regulatory subunit 3